MAALCIQNCCILLLVKQASFNLTQKGLNFGVILEGKMNSFGKRMFTNSQDCISNNELPGCENCKLTTSLIFFMYTLGSSQTVIS